jgi:predicted NBD/HSP70 family sugar kinase
VVPGGPSLFEGRGVFIGSRVGAPMFGVCRTGLSPRTKPAGLTEMNTAKNDTQAQGSAWTTPVEPRLQPRGSSQGGLRQYNERVVLQVVRLHGALPAAEIARETTLTAQTVSLITKRLLDDGLLQKGAPQRGKVGQPSVPLSLNPDGAYSIGLKLGRRSMDVLLIDFTGAVRERSTLEYRFPDPDELLAEIDRRLQALRRKLGPERRDRVHGVGIAAPLTIGGWQQLLGFPTALAERWQQTDLRAAVQAHSQWPVLLMKDTAAACVAELVAGRGRHVKSFVYVFVDTFIGGGLVLDSQLRGGSQGNAGALGSLPLWLSRGANESAPAQLLSVASLLNLEQSWAAAGLDTAADAQGLALQAPWLDHTTRWLDLAGSAVAQAVNSAACLLDVESVIVDGSCSRELLAALLAAVQSALPRYSWEGVSRPELLTGTIGSDARALGGALLPLYANFAPDRELFLKVAR